MRIPFRWLGNAGFEFKLGGTTLLVDPFLTRPNPTAVYFGRIMPDIPAIEKYIYTCSHILVTHTHFDHFMDVPAIARRTGAVIHGSPNTCALALKLGIAENQIHSISPDDEFSLGNIHVRAVSGAHPFIPGYTSGRLPENLKEPLRLRDYRMDTCLSFLITFKGARILVWSSTRTIGAVPADVLICRAVSGQLWYDRILGIVQPRWVITAHWDDMFRPLSSPPRPFFTAPRLALPPIRRIDLADFSVKIIKADPDCQVLIPQRFETESIIL